MKSTSSKAGSRRNYDCESLCRTQTLMRYANDNEGMNSLYNNISILNILDEGAQKLFDKELHLLGGDQFKRVIEDMCQINIRSIASIISILRGYIRWCKSVGCLPHEYDEYKAFLKHPALSLEITDLSFQKAFQKYAFKSAEEVCDFLDVACSRDGGNPAIPISVMCWSGVPSRNVYTVLEQDIDVINGTIVYDGSILHIPKAMLDWIRQYKDTDVVERQFRHIVQFEREKSKYFIKVFSHNSQYTDRPITTDMASNDFSRCTDAFNKATGQNRTVYANNIFLSGRLYEASQYLLANGELPDDVLADIFKNKKYMIPLTAKRTRHLVEEYIQFTGMTGA